MPEDQVSSIRGNSYKLPHRGEGEPIEEWRKRRMAAAAALAGGLAPADHGLAGKVDGLMEALDRLGVQIAAVDAGSREGMAELRARLTVLERPATRVELEDGRTFDFVDRDMLALTLAMFVAFRTGGAVDVPLTNGAVAEGLRAGELAEIARQLLEG